jgi:hypothetical protein
MTMPKRSRPQVAPQLNTVESITNYIINKHREPIQAIISSIDKNSPQYTKDIKLHIGKLSEEMFVEHINLLNTNIVNKEIKDEMYYRAKEQTYKISRHLNDLWIEMARL